MQLIIIFEISKHITYVYNRKIFKDKIVSLQSVKYSVEKKKKGSDVVTIWNKLVNPIFS